MTSQNPDTPLRVTREEIYQAAYNLWLKKIYPSANKIRELLGTRGSYKTIQLYLDSWFKETWEQPRGDDPLWQDLVKMRKKYEQQAKTDATNQIQNVKQECERQILESQELQRLAEQEKNTLAKKLQELENFTENLKENHQILNSKYREQEKQFYLAEQSVSTLKEELQNNKSNAEKQFRAQTADYENRLSLLTKQAEQDKSQLFDKINLLEKNYNDLKQSSGNQITDLKLKVQGLENALIQANEKEIRYITDLEKIHLQFATILEENNQIKNEKFLQSEKINNSEKEVSISQEKLKLSHIQIDDLKQQNKDMQRQLLDYSARIGQLEQKMATYKSNKKDKSTKP